MKNLDEIRACGGCRPRPRRRSEAQRHADETLSRLVRTAYRAMNFKLPTWYSDRSALPRGPRETETTK